MLSFRLTAARRHAHSVSSSQRGAFASALCLCVPLAAQALDATPRQASQIEVRSELVAAPADGGAAMGANVSAVPQAAMLSGAVRNTVWAQRGAASVGVGVQAPMGTVSSNLSNGASGSRINTVTPSLLVGVAVQTSPQSRLVLDTPLPYRSSNTDNSLNPTDGGREVRLGLVIKPADPLRNLRAGQLFKVELSGRSQVALKPRSGGVALSYSSKF